MLEACLGKIILGRDPKHVRSRGSERSGGQEWEQGRPRGSRGQKFNMGSKKPAKTVAKHRFSYKTIDFTRRLLILSSKSSRFASSFDQK